MADRPEVEAPAACGPSNFPAEPGAKRQRTAEASAPAPAKPEGAGPCPSLDAAAVAVGASGSGGTRASVFEVDQHHHCVLCPAFTRLVASQGEASSQGGILVNLDSHDDLGCPPTPNLESAELHRLLSLGDAAALKAMDIGAAALGCGARARC